MRCSRVRERFYEYLDGSLKSGELRAIEDHLKRCHACQRELESFKLLDARLKRDVPALWENVKPSPVFMARLKQTEIETPPKQAFGVADWLGGLWQNHRQALAAGVAACVVLALAISLPITLTRDGDDSQMIAKEDGRMLATAAPSPESGEPALKSFESTEGFGPEGMTVPAAAPMPSPTGEEDMLSGTYNITADSGGTTPPVPTTTPPEATRTMTMGTGFAPSEELISAQQKQLAVWLAFTDSDVKAALQGKTLIAIDVQQAIETEEFVCTGPTVILTIEAEDFSLTDLYVCVDLEAHEISQMISLVQ